MELCIISGLIVLAICIFVTIMKLKEEKKDNTSIHSIRVHGQDLYLDQKHYEEYRKKKIAEEEKIKEELLKEIKLKQQIFNNNVCNLKTRILKSKEQCNDIIDRQVFESLYKTEVKDEADYERLTFLFNNGHLRSNEEVHDYDWQIECKKYKENFNYERHKVNIIAFFLPFVTTFAFVTALAWKSLWFLSLYLSTFLALIAGYIGMMVGYKINLSNAKLYNMPDNDPGVRDEKIKYNAGVIGGVAATGSIIHNSKKAVKDITNVDGWKEMK